MKELSAAEPGAAIVASVEPSLADSSNDYPHRHQRSVSGSPQRLPQQRASLAATFPETGAVHDRATGLSRHQEPARVQASLPLAGHVNVAGVPVFPVSMAEVVTQIREWLGSEARRVAVGVNANLVNLASADPDLAAWLRRVDLAYPDGQSVVWACRALGATAPERVATTDLVHPLAQMCAREGATMFFFGGRPGVAARAATRLRAAEPSLRIEVHHGHVDARDMPAVVQRINRARADLLLVGLGDPLQQRWVVKHRDALQPRIVMTCGGLFDWLAGDNRRPPDWLVRSGLEWAWRLGLEPRRLARRYLLGNPAFVARFARAWVAERTA